MTKKDQFLKLIATGLSTSQAARQVNLAERPARRYAAQARATTPVFPPPEGHAVHRVTTQHDSDGNVERQWVKTAVDDARAREAMDAALKVMCETIAPARRTPQPKQTAAHLCNLYTFTDYHMGMLAWHREGGADWDIKIAERTLLDCFEAMVAQAPAAEVAVISQLGDFLHTDGLSPVTPTSHHVLDADSRFPKIVEATVRTLRRLVEMALAKHKRVHVVMAEGNHDMSSSVWLRELFSALYEREPRITIEKSPLPYYTYEFGSTFLGFHHGHLTKKEALPLLFAAQFAEAWGRTKHRAIHTGHLHHVDEKEHRGVTVIQHPTLSARDAYASRGGYIAARAATAITYSREHGEVGRVKVTPEMVAA